MSVLLVGVDLGGTALKAALADEQGRVIAEDSLPTQSHAGPEAVIERIAGLVESLAARGGRDARKVSGLGLGVPGLVDVTTGTTKFLPNLPTQWREVPVAEILERRLQCPVRLLNDVSILHPDLVVLGGGVAELGDILLDTVRGVIAARVGMFPTDNVEVARSLLGDQAGVMGALALAGANPDSLI